MATDKEEIDEPKKHCIEGLTAYYSRQVQKWCVEVGDEKHCYDSIELMVGAYPRLKGILSIRSTLLRRKVERKEYEAPDQKKRKKEDVIIVVEEECYYCSGSGIAGYLPCDNCGGEGTVKLTNRLR